jgi:hypothetical protein
MTFDFFATYNETKASIVERFNCTLKTKMWKYFTTNNTLKYVDILQKLVKSYNHSRHRSIRMRPATRILCCKHSSEKESKKSIQFKFSIGDQVRISKAKRTFKKGYLPNWTEEVFTETKRVPRRPPVYKIADYDGENWKEHFTSRNFRKSTNQTVTIIE